MPTLPHIPVLEQEVLRLLAPRPGGTYCDGTVGAAGHARRILELSAPDGRLIGIDRDPDALAVARDELAGFGARAVLVHGTFARIDGVLRDRGVARIDGVLLDVGMSSMQVDRADRGFSFTAEGPLDMRMDPTRGETAAALIDRLSAGDLARVLRDYGEERYSARIAQRIKDAARAGALRTTLDLAAIAADAIPPDRRRQMKIHPATRTFQALRIAVNEELDELRRFLDVFPDLLAPGARCVIISFHSLEDRLVKRRFRELAHTSSLPPALARQAGERVEPVCAVLTRKPVSATDDEIRANPRARSARLRACEKVAA